MHPRAFGQGKDINVNGQYVGRVIGPDRSTALLDVSVVGKDLAVTATVKSRANGGTYVVKGSRSVYRSTPVQLNLVSEFGEGSCGGFAHKYTAQVTFVEYERGSAPGTVNRSTCQSGEWQPDQQNRGQLELTRK
ncbi:hypothetical protein [Deinococcus radiophilus]|uniref:Uncharacterized protein n=1 Tax=Deinococcus radiophilus TaxID=32062 RepID=A0A431VYJ0_9DEIO|nr:hypothetical protein [Deinococcus radiophilus]RTR28321.1 hypothetical protein EJ104_05260 [Deinococcus radiophilus]UFA51185.1 hypothetical protein LMT64_04615 [Deinococcus radiophilus]